MCAGRMLSKSWMFKLELRMPDWAPAAGQGTFDLNAMDGSRSA